jgi:hypothetical protein
MEGADAEVSGPQTPNKQVRDSSLKRPGAQPNPAGQLLTLSPNSPLPFGPQTPFPRRPRADRTTKTPNPEAPQHPAPPPTRSPRPCAKPSDTGPAGGKLTAHVFPVRLGKAGRGGVARPTAHAPGSRRVLIPQPRSAAARGRYIVYAERRDTQRRLGSLGAGGFFWFACAVALAWNWVGLVRVGARLVLGRVGICVNGFIGVWLAQGAFWKYMGGEKLVAWKLFWVVWTRV